MVLANGQEGQGALVLYNFGWQMFFVPYAVLAVPIAISAFPVLAAAEGGRFDETAASSTRAIVLVSWLGAALLAGAAIPAARLFTHHPGDARQLAYTFAAFAPGLIGYGLSAHLSRVLFADDRTRVAAAGLVAGWLLVIVADVVAVLLVPDWWVVPVLGLGNTIGLTVSGLTLLAAVRRVRGRAALQGTARAALAGLAGAVAGAAAGAALSSALPARGFVPNAGLALLACACVTLVFGGAALALDGGDLRAVLTRGRDMLPGFRLAGRKPSS
jgi:putative peptidoglycan lipid II flippase